MDKCKLIIILILLCFTILIISNVADAKKYDRVKICGKWYTLGAADNVCPDYYFKNDAGYYNASNGTSTDPDCFYVNISVSNITGGQGYSNWSLITFPQKVNKKISKGRLGKVLSKYGIDFIAYCNNSTDCTGVGIYINTTYNSDWSTDFTEITPGKAYWVRSSNSTSLQIPYTWEQNYTLEVNNGTTMVGWYSNNTKYINDSTLNRTICPATYIYRWNTTTQWYESSMWNGTDWTLDFNQFEPGYGYWFETNQSCNWTYEP